MDGADLWFRLVDDRRDLGLLLRCEVELFCHVLQGELHFVMAPAVPVPAFAFTRLQGRERSDSEGGGDR